MKKNPFRLMSAALALILTLCMTVTSAFADSSFGGESGDYSGEMVLFSSYVMGEELADSFVFRDKWFCEPPEHQNDALALVSMQAQASIVDGLADGRGCEFLTKTGFSRMGFERFRSDDPDDCCYMWGIKKVKYKGEEFDLLAIHILSGSFDTKEKTDAWTQNFTVNDETSSGDHYAFSVAADKVLDELAALASYGSTGRVKLWITGHSRGGAVAGLIAARLPAMLGSRCAGTYAYTFESPANADGRDAAAAGSRFSYIHNYFCSDDIITHVPAWGMKCYGVGHRLDTDAINSGLISQLKKSGSSIAEADRSEKTIEISARMAERILARFDTAAPARKDYSAVRTDTVTDSKNSKITLTYSFQESMKKIMGVVFGSGKGVSGIQLSTTDFTNVAYIARDSVDPLITAAVKDARGTEDPSDDYWKAAKTMYSQLSLILNALDLTGNSSLDISSIDAVDLYSLFRLIGPALVDTDYEPSGKKTVDRLLYLRPLKNIMDVYPSFSYSHQFDTVIARLHIAAAKYKEYTEYKETAPEKTVKKAQPVKVRRLKKTLKVSKKTVDRKHAYISLRKYARVTGNKGRLTYSKVKGSKRITVGRSNGKLRVDRGTKKGIYTVKVKVTAAGNSKYRSASKTVTIRIRVK